MRSVAALAAVAFLLAAPAPVRAAAQPSAASAAVRPLSLADAVTAGLAASPEVKQATLDLDRANVALAGARAERLTYSADVAVADGYGANGLFSTSAVTAGQIPTANATLAARVPIFTGYRLERTIDQANAGVEAGRAHLDQARQALVWDITQAYWLARRAELREAIAAEAVERARQEREIVRKSKAIGQAGLGEVDRVEVAYLNQEGDRLAASDDRRVARDRLATLLQRDLAAVPLEDPPTPSAGALPEASAALASAYAHRPDVRLAEAQVAIANAAVDVAGSDRWPQLALEGAYQHGNNPFDPAAQSRVVLDRLTGDAYARLNLTYHLFDQGVIARNVESKRLEADSARQALAAARRAAELDVRQAIARLEGARRRVELGERSVALARRNLTYLENRFRFGYALVTEVNEARQNLVVADNQRADARIDAALASAALARAMGTLDAAPGGRPTP